MKIIAICPVTDRTVNENITRLNALSTLIIIIVTLFTQWNWLIYFLLLDFLLRNLPDTRYSPLTAINTFLVKQLNIRIVSINAGPKIFAARIGFFLVLVVVIALILELTILAYLIGGILAFFTFLESVFGICVACRIYPIASRLNQYFR